MALKMTPHTEPVGITYISSTALVNASVAVKGQPGHALLCISLCC